MIEIQYVPSQVFEFIIFLIACLDAEAGFIDGLAGARQQSKL
jgi:hypothetical protein